MPPMSHKRTNSPVSAAVKILLLACLAMPVWSQTAPSTPFTQCPAIGESLSCGVLIVVNANGSVSIYSDPNVPPYEGSDDTLIGVQNNSSGTITSLPINGGATQIFAFEGDGICDPSTSFYGPVPSGCPFGPYGYEGPGVTFTGINGTFQEATYCDYVDAWLCADGISGSYTAGTVNFSPGIPPGGHAYFALEEALTSGSITVPLSTTCPTSPFPTSASYSSQLTGTGGNGNYRWSLASGSLSPLTLSSTGLVSGTTPAAAVTLSFVLQISDTISDPPQQQPCSIVITPPALTLNCPAPGTATAGTSYSTSCTASGGTPSYNWTYSGLPSWLSGPASGATVNLTGTPPTPPPSSYSFTVTVTDSASPTKQTKSQTITINVGASTLTLNCPAPGTATAGTSYSTSCTASGGTPSFNWTYSGLPSWLSGPASGATVNLTGTPPAPPPSSYSFTVTVTDSASPTKQTKSQTITINVGASTLTLNCPAPGTATAGTSYSTSCTASGGTPSYNWTYSGLPSWLSGPASGATVNLTGTPPAPPPSSYSFTVTVTDSTSPTKQTKSQTITINVPVQPVQGIAITQSSGGAPNQTNLLVSFGQAAQSTYTGTLSLSFQHDPSVTNVPANYVDPAGGFPVSGSSTNLTQNFTVNQGTTQASVQFGLGTVAGTWTVTLTALNTGGASALPSPAPTYTVSVATAAPSITAGSVRIVSLSSSGFSVTLTGFATTRDVASGMFTFAAAAGAQLQGATVTVPFNGLDQSEWFNTAAGQSAGGTFSLTLPFGYSGDPSALGSVTVTLTNSRGQMSAAVSGGT